jgi:hypothetical protein
MKRCARCGKELKNRARFCEDCKKKIARESYLDWVARLKEWRASLDPSEQILFDQLNRVGRVDIIYGARSILCEGSWISGILPSIADKNDLKIDENWFSEKGRANLHRIKWQNTPPPEKLSCRICGEPISNFQFEEQDELCEECYEQESNTMEEEEFVSL